MHLTSLAPLLAFLVPGFALMAADTKPAVTADREAATRLQVFLDRANFGPGKIDGRYGGFTEKALGLYREANGLPPLPASSQPAAPAAEIEDKPKPDAKKSKEEKAEETPPPPPKTEKTLPLPPLEDMDLSGVKEVFVEYTVADADVKNTGTLPEKVPAMAELKWLPYASAAEALAEKFHCDVDYLKELNPGKLDAIKAGDTLLVPNVEPFDVGAVKELPLLDQLAMNREDADKAGDDEEAASTKKEKPKGKNKGKDKNQDKQEPKVKEKPAEEKPAITPAAQIAVKINTQDNMLRLFENEKLVAAYPVTIGSAQTQSPVGEWKVRGIARLPDFRYDLAFLKTGERGDKTYLLPPGPNNPVGVVWVALNKRGIGLHGTSDPDAIGRSASHGCVRLANWDIVRLATRVRGGVMVSIH